MNTESLIMELTQIETLLNQSITGIKVCSDNGRTSYLNQPRRDASLRLARSMVKRLNERLESEGCCPTLN
jgi:hypothetical protein